VSTNPAFRLNSRVITELFIGLSCLKAFYLFVAHPTKKRNSSAPAFASAPSANRTALSRIASSPCDALVSAGFDAPIRESIRWNIWLKPWGNVCFNPISALTLATLDRITSEPGLRALCKSMMAEAQALAAALGVAIPEQMMARRLSAAGSVVGHKMSMLQDLERGRSSEIDAFVPIVQELGRLVDVATPAIEAALALVQERGRQAGLY
jgi:ketopantoate reductase